MLSDPQTITVATVARVMPRTESDGTSSIYTSADGNWTLTIAHKVSKGRVRSLARLDQRAVVADPLTAQNDYQVLSEYYVIERPEYGFSSTNVSDHATGFKAWLDTTMIGKLYGRES
jgi:hypothetical protein